MTVKKISLTKTTLYAQNPIFQYYALYAQIIRPLAAANYRSPKVTWMDEVLLLNL